MGDVPSEFQGDYGTTFDEVDIPYIKSVLHEESEAIPVILFSVIQYMDPHTGKLRWKSHCAADAPVAQVVGLVEMAKLQMMAMNDCNVGLVEPELDA